MNPCTWPASTTSSSIIVDPQCPLPVGFLVAHVLFSVAVNVLLLLFLLVEKFTLPLHGLLWSFCFQSSLLFSLVCLPSSSFPSSIACLLSALAVPDPCVSLVTTSLRKD